MPQFIIKSKDASKWARVDIASKAKGDKPARRKIAWVGIEEATLFCDEAVAKSTLKAVADEMRSAAKESSERANNDGGRLVGRANLSYGSVARASWDKQASALPRSQKNEMLSGNASAQTDMKSYLDRNGQRNRDSAIDSFFLRYGKLKVPATVEDYLPQWCQGSGMPKCDMESVAAPQELLAPLEVWFVRSSRGWLGADGRFSRFFPELHQAMHYFSQEAARDAATNSRSHDCVLVKSQMLVSAVIPMPGSTGWEKDDISAALMCGCEARDIDAAIASVSKDRMDAVASAPKRRHSL